MARSIHTTRKTIQKLAAGNADLEKVQKASSALRRKRRIKTAVRKERRRPAAPLEHSDVSTIPIEVMDQAPHVLHALSISDIRALLARLPGAARDGISRIQLSLGAETQREYADDNDERDMRTACALQN